jgi:hypothetical protein
MSGHYRLAVAHYKVDAERTMYSKSKYMNFNMGRTELIFKLPENNNYQLIISRSVKFTVWICTEIVTQIRAPI